MYGNDAPVCLQESASQQFGSLMRPIEFRDIATDVQAFLGVTYASVNPGPCSCPPAVTCGATSCVSDLDCHGFGDGLCADRFCADACGRCTP